jgi:hypothetical protein
MIPEFQGLDFLFFMGLLGGRVIIPEPPVDDQHSLSRPWLARVVRSGGTIRRTTLVPVVLMPRL